MNQKREIPVNNGIGAYMHCVRCLHEVQQLRALGAPVSPREYARLNVGATRLGLQIWCVRHERNVFHIDYAGIKLNASTAHEDPGVAPDDAGPLPDKIQLSGTGAPRVVKTDSMTLEDCRAAIADLEEGIALFTDMAARLRIHGRLRFGKDLDEPIGPGPEPCPNLPHHL